MYAHPSMAACKLSLEMGSRIGSATVSLYLPTYYFIDLCPQAQVHTQLIMVNRDYSQGLRELGLQPLG